MRIIETEYGFWIPKHKCNFCELQFNSLSELYAHKRYLHQREIDVLGDSA